MKKTLSIIMSLCLILACFISNVTITLAETSSQPTKGRVDPEAPEIFGDAAILMEAETGAILYEKNSDKQLYPASITKIMTALLTIENCSMEDTVTFDENVISSIPYDAAILGVVAGEKMTVKDCLYALLMRSSNDVAIGLAMKISDTEESFATLMTNRAKQAGAINTQFANSTGLHDEKHYTTAYDMAMITKSAIQNQVFCQIAGMDCYTLSPTNKSPNDQVIYHRHNMLVSTRPDYYAYAEGGKTGYTDEAGNTLVTFAKKDGVTLICVVLKSDSKHVSRDTRALFDYGYSNFEKVNIAENETRFSQNEDNFFVKMNGIFLTSGSLVSIETGDYCMLPKGWTLNDLGFKIEYDDMSDGKIGNIKYYCGENVMGTTTLSVQAQKSDEPISPILHGNTSTEENNSQIPINIWYVVAAAAILVFLIVYIIYLVKTRDKRRRNRERKKVFKESKKRYKKRRRRPIKFK